MKKLILAISTIFCLSGCNYLDIVPDDTPLLEDAFKNEQTAEGFMYSCYAQIPDYTNFRSNIAWLTTPEVVYSYHWIDAWFASIGLQQGKYSASNPVVDVWRPSYRGIRQCYTFLDNMEGVPGVNISPEDLVQRKKEWKAQCNFLIAYYHYILLQHYGPIVIVDRLIDMNETGDEYYRPRKTYDECVEAIAEMFDTAIADLPVSVGTDDYGRPTKMAAQALKARMYLYAASPLFNGNSKLYANFKNLDGTNLISQTYDKEKWKKALDETEKAIKLAEEGGRSLYRSKKTGSAFDVAADAERYVMTDPWNEELIWGYSGTKETIDNGNSYQKHVIPRGMGATTGVIGGIGTTLPIVKMFFTQNGLPIDKDPDYKMDKIMTIEPGDSTIYLHRDREPRFYAWIGFDRGDYPCNGITNLKLRAGERNGAEWANGAANLGRDLIYGGYAIAKGIHPDAKMTATQRSIVSYPYILARLGELYLNYAEAYVEYYGKLDGKALEYINAIRNRAGIPNMETSYAKIGGLPTGDALINAVRLERTIELLFEGHMFYDYRRWMTASKEFAGMEDGMIGLNVAGATAEDFYKETRLTTQPYIFNSKEYLHPINQEDINVNRNLVQNPGWGVDILPEL